MGKKEDLMKRLLACILTLVLTLTSIPFYATASGLSDVQGKKSEIDKEIKDINKQKQKVIDNKAELEKNQKALLKQQNVEAKEYQQLVDEIKLVEKDLAALDKSIQESEANFNKQKELFKTKIRVIYETSNLSYFEMLIQSKSISDFFERVELISRIVKRNSEVIEEMETAKKDIEYKRTLSENIRLDKKGQVTAKQKEIETIKVSKGGLEERIGTSKAELERLEQQEDNLLKQAAQLANQIRNSSKKGTKYTGGSMIWPSTNSTQITSYYGMRYHPILKKNRMHTGLDINAANGTSIVAANKGKVLVAGWKGGYGNAVIIDHGGGITTLYAHSSKVLVSVGDTVEAGDTIAKVGSTGLSTGPHLHFEVRKDGELTNPLDYVSP
jgi:murein DD-endopeptidase MepM/ murein hydrolase activator NlpD